MGKQEREDEELGINRNDYRCDFEYENANKIAVAGAGAIIAGAAVGGPVGAGVAAKLMAGGLVAGAVDARIDQDLCERKKRGKLVREARRELKAQEDAKIEKLLDGARCEPPKPEEKKEEQPAPAVEEDRFRKELHAIIDAPDEKFEPRKVLEDLDKKTQDDVAKRRAENDAKRALRTDSVTVELRKLTEEQRRERNDLVRERKAAGLGITADSPGVKDFMAKTLPMARFDIKQFAPMPEQPRFEPPKPMLHQFKAPEMPKFEYKAPVYQYKPYVPKVDFGFNPAPAPIKAPPMPKFEYQAPAQYKQYEYKPYQPKVDYGWSPKF